MKLSTFALALITLLLFSCKEEPKQSTLNSTGHSVIDKLSEQIAVDKGNPDLFFQRGSLFYESSLFDEAIADLESAISIDSTKADYYHALSNAYMDYYKSKKALSTMEQAALRFPDRIPTLLKLSETQLILKKHEDMNITLRRIISKDPQNAEAYFMMGMMFRSIGDMEKAKNAFQVAIEYDPELIDGWLIMGNIFEEENDPIALQYYKSATQADSTNIQAYHSMAYYLQNHDEVDEALQIYRKINRLNRQYPDAYLNAGILLLERSDLDGAFEQFNLLVGVAPKYFLGYYYRGIVNEMMGNKVNAKNDYQTCLNFNPNFEKAKEAIAAVGESEG